MFDNSIERIIRLMYITHSYYWHVYNINELLDDRAISYNVKKIKRIINRKMEFYFQIAKDDETSCQYTGRYKEYEFLVDQYIIIEQIIQNMYKTPIINYLDPKILFVISQINNCLLFRLLKSINSTGYEPEELNVDEFGEGLLEYYRLLNKLTNLKEPNNKYTFNQEEVDCWWIVDLKLEVFQYNLKKVD